MTIPAIGESRKGGNFSLFLYILFWLPRDSFLVRVKNGILIRRSFVSVRGEILVFYWYLLFIEKYQKVPEGILKWQLGNLIHLLYHLLIYYQCYISKSFLSIRSMCTVIILGGKSTCRKCSLPSLFILVFTGCVCVFVGLYVLLSKHHSHVHLE